MASKEIDLHNGYIYISSTKLMRYVAIVRRVFSDRICKAVREKNVEELKKLFDGSTLYDAYSYHYKYDCRGPSWSHSKEKVDHYFDVVINLQGLLTKEDLEDEKIYSKLTEIFCGELA